ncbi:MAG: PIN domain-containing protein [Melioribacteraceae bacterium]
MKKFLIDSVILIDHLNDISKATNWLRKNGNTNSVISVITRAEILVGTSTKNKLKITAWLDSFECIEIDKEITDLAALCRNKYKIKLPDAFQSAIALKKSLALVTRNTKDFNTKKGFVKIPYKV